MWLSPTGSTSNDVSSEIPDNLEEPEIPDNPETPENPEIPEARIML